MKRISVFFAGLFTCILSYGQGEMDAFKFSRNDISGSARGVAMGGAFGALGADITGVASNPAGIGLYRSSEVLATMNFSSANIETNMNGSIMKNSQFKFNFDNLAYMGYFPTGNDDVVSYNLGFAYNRLKNFDRDYNASGRNIANSQTKYIESTTNELNVSPDDLMFDSNYNPYKYNSWLSVLGYDSYLINSAPVGRNRYQAAVPDGVPVNPSLSVSERGAIESYDFTGGLNITDKLYFGVTVGVTDIKYVMTSRYTEDFKQNEGYDMDNYLETNGSGYNVALGLIYRPIDALRIGAAYHSPTWYNMTDFYNAKVDFNIWDDEVKKYQSGVSSTPTDDAFAYNFQTPYRWVFSAAAILGKRASLSVDYELKDYSGMSFHNQDGLDLNYYEPEKDNPNDFISADFKMASTLKAGFEFLVTPRVALRAGYSWMQSPLDPEVKDGQREIITVGTVTHYVLEGDANYYSAGLGFRLTKSFYIDAAFTYRTQKDYLYAFSPIFSGDVVASTPIAFNNNTYKGLLTLGYKF